MIKVIIVIFTLIFSSIATTAVYHKTKQADINYYKGKAYFDRGEFRKAVPFFEKALTIDPFQKDAILKLGYAYQWSGRNKEAAFYLKESVNRSPRDYKVKKALADSLSWQGNYSEAITVYLDIFEKTADFDTLKDLARAYLWDGQFDKARQVVNKALEKNPGDAELNLLYAQVLLYGGDYASAEEIIREIINKEPGNNKAREYLGDLLSYSGHYAEAIEIYSRVASLTNDYTVLEKLARVLSWDRQYRESVETYDNVLVKNDDTFIRTQKARVLGWARRYRESIGEYVRAISRVNDPAIELEMLAKKAYWNQRIRKAIDFYSRLLNIDARNSEAAFDLAQIYAYQSMWDKAILEYNRLLHLYPNHFQAREGLKKARLIRFGLRGRFGYDYLEQTSLSRDTDVRKHSVFGDFSYFLNEHLNLGVQYKFSTRSFTDFSRLTENEGRFELNYSDNPDWRAGAYYDFIGYGKGINPMHTFGLNAGVRAFDFANASLFFDRKRLENNSTVIQKRLYSDNYKVRWDLDANYRLKMGAEYTFMDYSDGNYNNLPAVDLKYLVSLEPKELSLKYRYFYQNYRRKLTDYFSPKGFSTNVAGVNWGHSLSRKESFFGNDELYYDLGYQASVDSQDIVCHNFNAGLYWDISRRFNLNIVFSQTESSASVYKDKSVSMRARYYF